MENVLGIDLGGKAVGLAVVEQPTNRVQWCGTVRLSDKIKDLYDLRRTLRRARRSRVRYRKPKVAQRGGGSGGKGEEGATYFYRKAKGLNQSLRTKCKYVDPQTGEVCGKNTPQMANVRHSCWRTYSALRPLPPPGTTANKPCVTSWPRGRATRDGGNAWRTSWG